MTRRTREREGTATAATIANEVMTVATTNNSDSGISNRRSRRRKCQRYQCGLCWTFLIMLGGQGGREGFAGWYHGSSTAFTMPATVDAQPLWPRTRPSRNMQEGSGSASSSSVAATAATEGAAMIETEMEKSIKHADTSNQESEGDHLIVTSEGTTDHSANGESVDDTGSLPLTTRDMGATTYLISLKESPNGDAIADIEVETQSADEQVAAADDSEPVVSTTQGQTRTHMGR